MEFLNNLSGSITKSITKKETLKLPYDQITQLDKDRYFKKVYTEVEVKNKSEDKNENRGIEMKKIIGIFVLLITMIGVCSCSGHYDKYINEVKTGCLGGCFDTTIAEVFDQTMPKGNWSGGETDEGKIIVEYGAEPETGKIQIQFTVEDDNNFKISAIRGDSVRPQSAAEAGTFMRNIFVQYYSSKYPDKAGQKLMPNEPDENLLTGISSVYAEKAKNPSDIANQLDKSKDSIKTALNISDSEDGLEDTGLAIMFNEDDSAIDSVEISNSRIYTLFGVQTYQAYEGTEEKLADRFVIASERDNPDGTHLAAFIRNNSEDSLVITYDSAIGYIKDVQYIRNGFEGYRAEQEKIKKEAEEKAAAEAKAKEEAARHVNSASEAEKYVKAYYLSRMNKEDPEGYLDRYTSFVAVDRGTYYEVCASFDGNLNVDFSIYQIQKNDKNDIIEIGR